MNPTTESLLANLVKQVQKTNGFLQDILFELKELSRDVEELKKKSK